MVEPPEGWLAVRYGHGQSLLNQGLILFGCHGPTDNAPRVQVHHRCKMRSGLLRWRGRERVWQYSQRCQRQTDDTMYSVLRSPLAGPDSIGAQHLPCLDGLPEKEIS